MDSIPWDSSPSNHDLLGIFLELFPTTFYKQIYACFWGMMEGMKHPKHGDCGQSVHFAKKQTKAVKKHVETIFKVWVIISITYKPTELLNFFYISK